MLFLYFNIAYSVINFVFTDVRRENRKVTVKEIYFYYKKL